MSKRTSLSSLHQDAAEFKAALEYTQSETGFQSTLIEKDYYCSLILHELFRAESGDHSLVFKGGTCLNKVHLGFYRLSEDLDFCISVPIDTNRKTRSKAKETTAKLFKELPRHLPMLKIETPLIGSNDSTQYNGELSYYSIMSPEPGRVKVEISVREPLIHDSARKDAKTLLLNPFTQKPTIHSLPLQVIDLTEAMAEKVRAALSRRQPAIRDLFDLGYAHARGRLPTRDAAFIELVRLKLGVPGNVRMPLTPRRLEEFQRQVETELRPVLREQDFVSFRFDELIEILRAMDQAIGDE